MPKPRSPDRDKAFEIYRQHNGEIDLVEIAKMLNLPPGTVRGWKNKDRWDDKMNGTLQTDMERSERKRGAPIGNKNAVGNAGGAPPGNKNAEKHGLFSKYLPEETLDLIKSIETRSPLDLLWDQIMIQYAAIIRSQQIMYVKDQNDLTKVLKREKQSQGDTSSSWEEEYELQFAWDKQANFLKAQSRAMGELRSMIKQYDELLNTELATEEQKARIAVLKAKVNDGQGKEEPADDGFIEALKGQVSEVWADGEQD